ncbi:DegT/DnrJ/EryC1/StrS family aminotransferase [Portibacter lacus]|nr:DegT/DnrJ/EryC1/StrS family aminotransferase [Portibacter lacus]
MKNRKIPYLSFDGIHDEIEEELIRAASDVIKSKWYIHGKSCLQFEKEYGSYSGSDYAVGVNSGLDGLIISLQCLNIRKGDEVLVASNAYIACWNAIARVGATIVPIEPSSRTYNIDINKIEERITSKTKAIMAVHLYGQMCDMDALINLAKKYQLSIIEDNAQSQGASYNHQKSSSIGQISSTSFYPGKNLGALGDAGIITTNNSELAEKAKKLRNYGSSVKYVNEVIGHNSRLDEMQAALLSVKLKYLDQWNAQRREIAQWYNERLGHEWAAIHPSNVCHVYCIQSEARNELQKHLNGHGVQTLIHYPIPPHLQQAYEHLNYKKGDFPIAERLAEQSLSLPIYPGLSESDIDYICDLILEFNSK